MFDVFVFLRLVIDGDLTIYWYLPACCRLYQIFLFPLGVYGLCVFMIRRHAKSVMHFDQL